VITMAPGTQLRVPDLLKERGLTASWLMREAKLSWPTAQGLAAGHEMNVTLDTLEKVSKALGVPIAALFAQVGEESG
jgi:DNA-binding Xre family transcriptional regulator